MAEDIRITKNKRSIESALLQLLEEKPFEKITVHDICQLALVSRSTFYAHYVDKYALLEHVVNQYFAMLETLIAKKFTVSEPIDLDAIFTQLSQTYSRHRGALRVLMNVHVPEYDLREKIAQTLFSYCMDYLSTTSQSYAMPNALIARLYVANIITIIDWMLAHGIDDTTSERLKTLQSMFFHFAKNGVL